MGRVLVSASHYDTLCREALKMLKENGHEVVFDPDRSFPAYTCEELKKILIDIDAAIIGLDEYTEEVFQAAPRLKAVAKFGVGVDNIDCEAAKSRNIKVINAPGMNSNSVSELTVGVMLDLLRRVIPLHEQVVKGRWPRYIGHELKGKTVGLLGFGAIARLVAEKLQCFGVNILAYDLYPNYEKAKELHVDMVSMEDVVSKSDIVSLHIPPSPETYHLFDDKMFGKMKEGSYLINAARGALVDLDSLSRALQSGRLAGAAIDAFEAEPLPCDAPILSCDNIILTPHTGGETYESYSNVSVSTARDIIYALAGKEPLCWANR